MNTSQVVLLDEVRILRPTPASEDLRTGPDARERALWQEIRPSSTDVIEVGNVVSFERALRREQPRALPLAERVRFVVVGIEDRTVHCEAELNGNLVEIALLPDLFSEPPQFGMVFDLSMVSINGIQQPKVDVRATAEADDALADRARDLLSGF